MFDKPLDLTLPIYLEGYEELGPCEIISTEEEHYVGRVHLQLPKGSCHRKIEPINKSSDLNWYYRLENGHWGGGSVEVYNRVYNAKTLLSLTHIGLVN